MTINGLTTLTTSEQIEVITTVIEKLSLLPSTPKIIIKELEKTKEELEKTKEKERLEELISYRDGFITIKTKGD